MSQHTGWLPFPGPARLPLPVSSVSESVGGNRYASHVLTVASPKGCSLSTTSERTSGESTRSAPVRSGREQRRGVVVLALPHHPGDCRLQGLARPVARGVGEQTGEGH